MKILSWDVNQGKDCPDLMDMINTLQEHQSEVIFLHDFLNNRQGQILRNTMNELGWEHQYFTGIGSMGGILILSKKQFSFNRCNYKKPSKSYGWLDILFSDYRMSILAVHIPQDDRFLSKDEYWERLLEYSKIKTVDDCLIISTMCTECTAEAVYKYPQPIHEIKKTGWVDLIQDYLEKNPEQNHPIKDRLNYAFASRMVYDSIASAYLSKNESNKGYSRPAMVLEVV